MREEGKYIGIKVIGGTGAVVRQVGNAYLEIMQEGYHTLNEEKVRGQRKMKV